MSKGKPEEKLQIVKVVVAVVALIGAGFIIYKSMKGTAEEKVGTMVRLKCALEECDYSETLTQDDFEIQRAPAEIELMKQTDPDLYAEYEAQVTRGQRKSRLTPEKITRDLVSGLGSLDSNLPMKCPKCGEYSVFQGSKCVNCGEIFLKYEYGPLAANTCPKCQAAAGKSN